MYALFAGQTYYAVGGYNDFCGNFNTAEHAVSIGEELLEHGMVMSYDSYYFDWWHVVDLSTGRVVARSSVTPFGEETS